MLCGMGDVFDHDPQSSNRPPSRPGGLDERFGDLSQGVSHAYPLDEMGCHRKIKVQSHVLTGLRCTDRLPGMLLLRHRSVLSQGLDHGLLLVVDPTGFSTSTGRAVHRYSIFGLGLPRVHIDGYVNDTPHF